MRCMMALAAALVCAASPARPHDPYSSWMIPGTLVSCCNKQDCAPTRARADMDGNWEAWHAGKWIPIPPRSILKFPSPDGRSHLCINPFGVVLCFVPGEVKS